MTNNELLLAISNMLDPIREDVREIKGSVKIIENKVETLENKVEALENKVEALEDRVGTLEVEVKTLGSQVRNIESEVKTLNTRVKKIEIMQETEILPRLETMESCYTSTYNRYKDSVEDYEIIKQDISLIKKTVVEHSEKLQKIG